MLEFFKKQLGVERRRRSNRGTRAVCGVAMGPSSIPLWDRAVPLSSKILDFIFDLENAYFCRLVSAKNVFFITEIPPTHGMHGG